jgi:ribonuclease BN (tRNA processing enzyme)
MKGLKQFVDFTPGNGPIYETERLRVETQPVNHPGGCVAYRFTERAASGNKVFVFNTDFEPDGIDDKIVQLWHNADLVVADGQYEPPGTKDTPNPFMPGWGHSSWKQDIDLAAKAGAKRLLLTHHEPKMDDNYHKDLEARAQAYAASASPGLSVALAREGAEYDL